MPDYFYGIRQPTEVFLHYPIFRVADACEKLPDFVRRFNAANARASAFA
jgi:hypothetical protein